MFLLSVCSKIAVKMQWGNHGVLILGWHEAHIRSVQNFGSMSLIATYCLTYLLTFLLY